MRAMTKKRKEKNFRVSFCVAGGQQAHNLPGTCRAWPFILGSANTAEDDKGGEGVVWVAKLMIYDGT